MSFYLVQSFSITVADALSCAYMLVSADKITDVAIHLHVIIHRAFKETQTLPWPPMADDLDIKPELLPNELIKFLYTLLFGKPEDKSDKTQYLILSVSQDL